MAQREVVLEQGSLQRDRRFHAHLIGFCDRSRFRCVRRDRHRFFHFCVARDNRRLNHRYRLCIRSTRTRSRHIYWRPQKNLPLRCRGSDPSGGPDSLRRSTCVFSENVKSCTMSVNVRALSSTLSRSSDRLSRSERCRKCSGAHRMSRPCTTIQTVP